jgi:hypothetical protein
MRSIEKVNGFMGSRLQKPVTDTVHSHLHVIIIGDGSAGIATALHLQEK